MRQRVKQLTALLVLCALCLSLLTPPQALAASEHAEVDYTDMTYAPFYLQAFTKRAETLQQISQEAVNANAVLVGFGGLERLYRECSTNAALAQITYRQDTSDTYWAQAAQTEQENLQQVNTLLLLTAQEILQSPCAYALKNAWGEALCQMLLQQNVPSAEEQALLNREQVLLAEYDQAYRNAFNIHYRGEWIATTNPWLVDLPEEQAEEYRQMAFEQGNAILGPIFQELVQVRTQLAGLRGYENYTDYVYAQTYGRDYTAADIEAFHEQVATYIVPLLEMMVESWQEGASQFMPEVDASAEGALKLLAEQLPQLAPKLTEAYSYMLRHHLYDVGAEENRFAISYTTFLPQYGAPFMQIKQTQRTYDLFNLIHEFGHYNNYYQNADDYSSWLQPVSYDLAEVHSQGLEMLLAARYQAIWGKQAGRSAALYHLINSLDVVIQGCMEDEFQQAVYANPEMSLTAMNSLYGQLKEKYQVFSVGESDGSWVLVPNTFHAPLYYISYSVSMTAALELWTVAQRDEDAAVEKYLYLVDCGERYRFQEVLAASGLHNPFQDGSIKNLAQLLGSAWGYSKGRHVRFLDVSGHWAQEDIYQAVQRGLFAGTEPMIFQPEAPLTRASAVVLLSRILHANLYHYSNQQVFDDVAPDSWYGPAVAWAAEQGLVSGVEDGRFAPNEPISREQLAAMLSPLLETKTTAGQANFADQAAISAWAQESVQKVAQAGLMNGQDGLHFAPQSSVTRAEAAVIFVRLLKLGNYRLQAVA